MKHSIKTVSVLLFAIFFFGCLPQKRLTGRVVDEIGLVPGTAVLAMVWVEDAGQSLPVPDINNLGQEEVDAVLEKDMKDRGLPMAYARAFTDEQGAFTLDKLYFSAKTKRAVKAMQQPKITRITINAFQRGYLKHAATRFPKGMDVELSPAVVKLSKPANWKQLALDNYFRQLRRDEYDQAYSKHFGAAKEEKKWFLDYMSANLNEAYQASNIKGDKQWEEDCGRDFSDIVISISGMQRNPGHERCNLLLRQAGTLRDWEKLWVDHALARNPDQSPAISAVKEAIAGLGPEYAEVKQYEAQIIAGAEEAAAWYNKGQGNTDFRNGLKEASPIPVEAQRLYNNGDKAGAYKALGFFLYSDIPAGLKQGAVTAMLPLTAIPKIKETTAGFYLLMNRLLTAQLPGGDGGNHGEKSEVKGATETVKDDGLRVVLAEKEIIVTVDGKEVRRELVADSSKKKELIFGEAQAELKKGEKLHIEERELKPRKLLFYDRAGKARKELFVGERERKVVRKRHVLMRSDGPVSQDVSFKAVASENGKYALYVESVLEYQLFEDSSTKKLCLGETSNIKYFSSDGRISFEKQLPPARFIAETALSENGKVVVMTIGCEVPDSHCPNVTGEDPDALRVYNEKGQKLLGHPSGFSYLMISPNGKYLSGGGVRNSIVFFNTRNKKQWLLPKDIIVHKINDNGTVELYEQSKKEEIDLTKYLGY